MKYLINSDFVAVRKGDFVKADEEYSEFIYNSNAPEDVTVAALKEIAAANKIKIKDGNKSEILEQVNNGLEKLKLAEANTMSDTDKVKEIVLAGHEAGKEENDILVEIVTSGIDFKSAVKHYKQAQEELGLALTPKKRYALAKDVMEEEQFSPENYDDVTSMTDKLQAKLDDTNEKQALAAIRKYCKEIEVEMPKKPKASGGVSGFRAKAFKWVEQNPTASDDEFRSFVEENKEADKVDVVVKRFAPIRELARNIATA